MRVLHTVRSSTSSSNFQYPLFSLTSSRSCLRLFPRLPVTSILPSFFTSIIYFRRQFQRKMWPIQLAFILLFYIGYSFPIWLYVGTAVVQWLRCCATNRKVTGSIPAGFIGIFHWRNPSDRTMALGSTQPLTEMSTRSISWGWRRPVRKNDNLPPSCAVVTKSVNLNYLEPSGPLQACNGTDLPLFGSM